MRNGVTCALFNFGGKVPLLNARLTSFAMISEKIEIADLIPEVRT